MTKLRIHTEEVQICLDVLSELEGGRRSVTKLAAKSASASLTVLLLGGQCLPLPPWYRAHFGVVDYMWNFIREPRSWGTSNGFLWARSSLGRFGYTQVPWGGFGLAVAAIMMADAYGEAPDVVSSAAAKLVVDHYRGYTGPILP